MGRPASGKQFNTVVMLHVDKVEWLGGHVLRLLFDDGAEKVVDVLPLLNGPVFEPLRDATAFAEVRIDPVAQTVVWPNGADLAPEALFALDERELEDYPAR